MGRYSWQPLATVLLLATFSAHQISIVSASGPAGQTTDRPALMVAAAQLAVPATNNYNPILGGVPGQLQPRIAGPLVVDRGNGEPIAPRRNNIPAWLNGAPKPTPGTIARPKTTINNRTTGNAATRLPQIGSNGPRANVVCFYASYAATRFGQGRLRVDDIDPNLCTHIIYGSLGLDDKNEIEAANPEIDLKEYDGLDSINKLFKLKQLNPELKTLVSVGGADVSAKQFSSMASKSEARIRFIKSVLNFLATFRLDGLDINWQYPGSKDGGSPNDKDNFVMLLRELKSVLAPKGYLLTAQVAGQKAIIDAGFNIPQVVRYLDLINLIAYDYHETHNNRTGVLAPVNQINRYNDARDTVASIRWSVSHWVQMGAEPRRIMLGLAFYGQTYELDNPTRETGIGAPAIELGEPGSHTSVAGVLGYNEICIKFIEKTNGPMKQQGMNLNWTIKVDEVTRISYAYRQKEWMSFDDPASVARKTSLAMSGGLGGVFLFGLDTDDFLGLCHNVKYPLTRSAKFAIERAAPQA